MKQSKLVDGQRVHRYSGPFSDLKKGVQRIRITEGCPNQCEFCYEPKTKHYYPMPEIISNKVQILDMNFTARRDCMDIINRFGQKRVNGKVVEYELVCGIDYRYLFDGMARQLKENRFIKPRIAWDGRPHLQGLIKDAIDILAKYWKREEIMVFVLCNHGISSYKANNYKLDLLKIWGVKVCDCYWDGQVSPNIIPLYWTSKQINDFRRRCRKHNQMIRFKIDPEIK